MAPTIGKSYMSRSEHSLVTDLREDHRHRGGHHRGRRRSGFQHSNTASGGNTAAGFEVGDSEAGSEYSELSEDEDSEEAELTRLKRFCWAICCCCRCYSCCQESDEVVVAAIAADESASMASNAAGVVNKGRGCDCSLVTAWEKAVGFRNCIRDRLEFAEYGKVCYLSYAYYVCSSYK